MRNLLFIIIVLITSFCNAQDYTPLLEFNKTWNMYLHNDTGGGYPFDIEPIELVEISGQSYFRIVASHNGCTTYLREDPIEKKVYGYWEGNEYLHYDYSKDVGDSIWILGILWEITSIGYGDFYGMNNLRYFALEFSSNSITLIEGIGIENKGIADAFEYGCLHVPIYETVSLINMNHPLSVDDNELPVLNIYPNPVRSSLFVTSNFENLEMKLFNISGQILIKQILEFGASKIDLSYLESGIYILTWESSYGNGVKQIIKK